MKKFSLIGIILGLLFLVSSVHAGKWIIQLKETPQMRWKKNLGKTSRKAVITEYQEKVLAKISTEKNVNCQVRERFFNVFSGFSISTDSEQEIESWKNMEEVVGIYPVKKIHVKLNRVSSEMKISRIRESGDIHKNPLDGRGVTIAVVDTGVDYTHPALGGGFGGSFKIKGGFDFVNNDPDPMDDNGHGTHIAGVICAEDSLYGGIAPKVKVLVYKVLDKDGNGDSELVLMGIERALEEGADIINMSFGAQGSPKDELAQAADRAFQAGVLVVAAAGNEGPEESTISSPGCARQAICVGSIGFDEEVSVFSSRGPCTDGSIKPDILAYGEGLTTCSRGGGFSTSSGTSISAPVVSGALALILQRSGGDSPENIRNALYETTDLIPQISSNVQGRGKINLAKFIGKYPALPFITGIKPEKVAPFTSQQVILQGRNFREEETVIIQNENEIKQMKLISESDGMSGYVTLPELASGIYKISMENSLDFITIEVFAEDTDSPDIQLDIEKFLNSEGNLSGNYLKLTAEITDNISGVESAWVMVVPGKSVRSVEMGNLKRISDDEFEILIDFGVFLSFDTIDLHIYARDWAGNIRHWSVLEMNLVTPDLLSPFPVEIADYLYNAEDKTIDFQIRAPFDLPQKNRISFYEIRFSRFSDIKLNPLHGEKLFHQTIPSLPGEIDKISIKIPSNTRNGYFSIQAGDLEGNLSEPVYTDQVFLGENSESCITGKISAKENHDNLSEIRIDLFRDGDWIQSGISDSSGEFEMKNLEPGNYMLRIYDLEHKKYYPSVKAIYVQDSVRTIIQMNSVKLVENSKQTVENQSVPFHVDRVIVRGDLYSNRELMAGDCMEWIDISGKIRYRYWCDGQGEITALLPENIGMQAGEILSVVINGEPGKAKLSGGITYTFVYQPEMKVQISQLFVDYSHRIPLKMGWNLISMGMDPGYRHPYLVFSNILSKLICVLGFESDGTHKNYEYFIPSGKYSRASSLQEVEPLKGYWIRVGEDCELVLKGTAMVFNKKMTLPEGFHLISNPLSYPASLGEIFLSGMEDVEKIYLFSDNQWNEIQPMENKDLLVNPFQGIWIKCDKEVEIIIQ